MLSLSLVTLFCEYYADVRRVGAARAGNRLKTWFTLWLCPHTPSHAWVYSCSFVARSCLRNLKTSARSTARSQTSAIETEAQYVRCSDRHHDACALDTCCD
jgi:hypothetical protein